MKNELSETDLLDELDSSTRNAVASIRNIQPQLGQMQKTLEKIKAMSLCNEPSRSVTQPHRKTRWGARSFLSFGVTAVALIAIGFFVISAIPASGLASQMARSLASQDWIRVSQVYDGQVTSESWFSNSQELLHDRARM